MAQMVKGLVDCPPECRFQMADGTCDYLCQAGHRRGCPPGWDCTRYEPAEDYRPKTVPPPRPQHEVEGYTRRPTAVRALEADPKANAMWEAGASDKEIGAATGWSPSSVRKWRHQTGRESRYGQ